MKNTSEHYNEYHILIDRLVLELCNMHVDNTKNKDVAGTNRGQTQYTKKMITVYCRLHAMDIDPAYNMYTRFTRNTSLLRVPVFNNLKFIILVIFRDHGVCSERRAEPNDCSCETKWEADIMD